MQSYYIKNTDFEYAIRKNKRHCVYLLASLFIIMAILGYLLGWYIELSTAQYPSQYNNYYNQPNQLFEISRMGFTAALFAIALCILWSAIAIFSGSKIILFSANAKEILPEDKDSAVLNNIIEEVCIAAGTPKPKTYVIETEALNAFATGMSPDNASVAITRGLLNKLTRDELQGVMAHEIGHIINYDIRYQTLVSVVVGLIVLISDIAMRVVFYSSRGSSRNRSSNSNNNGAGIIGLVLLAFSIIAPIAALILQMSVSRQREYLADATSVKLTRNPYGLISALEKLGADANAAKPFAGASKANQNLFIVNPFRRVAKARSRLLSTHPPLEDRIARLKNLGDI